MSSARLSDSPKDSYFAGAASPSSLKEAGNFRMDLSASSPGATGDEGGGSPVRRTRSRALHAAVISLELKGEDRCLVRMDVSFGSWWWSVCDSKFFFSLHFTRARSKSSLSTSKEREREKREREKKTSMFSSLSHSPPLSSKRSPLDSRLSSSASFCSPKNKPKNKNQTQVPWPESENKKSSSRGGSARSTSSSLRPLVASQGQDLPPLRDGPSGRSKAHAVRALSSHLSVFAVFDGHNGPLAAEHLAETLIETLHARLPKGRPPRRQGCCLSDSGEEQEGERERGDFCFVSLLME